MTNDPPKDIGFGECFISAGGGPVIDLKINRSLGSPAQARELAKWLNQAADWYESVVRSRRSTIGQ